MRNAHRNASTTRARRKPAALWGLSAAARRGIRQRVALATELNLHSVAVAGTVWTLRHTSLANQLPQGPTSGSASCDTSTREQRTKQRSLERAKAHRLRCEAVDALRVKRAFKWWQSLSQPALPFAPPMAPPLPPTLPPPPEPPPEAPQPSPPPQQQRHEGVSRMDDERGVVRVRSSPSAGASPIAPHAQRVRRELVLPLPPPSAPPPPPSSNPKGETTPRLSQNKQSAEGASSWSPAYDMVIDGIASSVSIVSSERASSAPPCDLCGNPPCIVVSIEGALRGLCSVCMTSLET